MSTMAGLKTCKSIFYILFPKICQNIPKYVDTEDMVKEITPGYYDDVITDGLKPDRETGVIL